MLVFFSSYSFPFTRYSLCFNHNLLFLLYTRYFILVTQHVLLVTRYFLIVIRPLKMSHACCNVFDFSYGWSCEVELRKSTTYIYSPWKPREKYNSNMLVLITFYLIIYLTFTKNRFSLTISFKRWLFTIF